MGIAHQNLLLCLQSNGVVLLRIVAVAAGALRSAEAIVREALAVELEAARLAAVARLVALRGELLLEGKLSGRLGMARSVCVVEKPLCLSQGVFIACHGVLFHANIAVVHLQSLSEGVVDRRDGGSLSHTMQELLRAVRVLGIAVCAHPFAWLGELRLDGGVVLPLKLLKTLLRNDSLVQG